VGSVALLPWCLPIGFEDLVDEICDRSNARPLPRSFWILCRHCVPEGFSDQPPVHAKFASYALDGSNPELVLPPDRLK
jgi:hypothetical protein